MVTRRRVLLLKSQLGLQQKAIPQSINLLSTEYLKRKRKKIFTKGIRIKFWSRKMEKFKKSMTERQYNKFYKKIYKIYKCNEKNPEIICVNGFIFLSAIIEVPFISSKIIRNDGPLW